MLSQETIEYIREWAESGNEPRCLHNGIVNRLDLGDAIEELPFAVKLRLNSAGLTIAKLAAEVDRLSAAWARGYESGQEHARESIEQAKAEAWEEGVLATEEGAQVGLCEFGPNPYSGESYE